jgi:hypothetical protein
VRSRKLGCRVQAVTITYSECVPVALVTQHATRICRVTLLSTACPTVQHFWYYLINGRNLGEKLTIKCVLFVELLLERSLCKVPVIVVTF